MPLLLAVAMAFETVDTIPSEAGMRETMAVWKSITRRAERLGSTGGAMLLDSLVMPLIDCLEVVHEMTIQAFILIQFPKV